MNTGDNDVIVGIDGSRLSVAQPTGTENYTAQIITHLARIAAPDTLRVYLRSANVPEFLRDLSGVEPVPIPFPRFWTHWRLSQEVLRRPPDVLFVPAHVVPLAHPRTVVTVHDLGYFHHPESHPSAQRRMLDLTTRWSVHAARHIIAISDSTRRDLTGAYGVASSKITVIPHGTDPPQSVNHSEIDDVRTRLGLTEPFVLTVGTIQPRKNLPRLVEAFNHVAESGLPHRLVIAGKPGWLADRVMAAVAAADRHHRTLFVGYASPSDLRALYAAADAFALPSLYEGFGMPALDALAAGVPTLLADRSSLPEIGGDAALYVNPMDTAEMGRGLQRLLMDTGLRTRLKHAGPAQARRYSWENAARSTLDVLRSVAS